MVVAHHPQREGVDEKQMEMLLTEGTWPDGFSPEERENLARLAPNGHSQPPERERERISLVHSASIGL